MCNSKLIRAVIGAGIVALSSLSAAESAILTGSVSNTATSNLLEGARIEVPQLQRAALVDNTGSYVLTGLPTGTYEIVASYIGLDSVRRQVTIAAGQRVVQNFDLTTGIYKMDQFKVTGEREGDAAAITAYRNSENLKNIAATDSFGNLPNLNAGEVAIRLPGIYGELDAGGNLSGFTGAVVHPANSPARGAAHARRFSRMLSGERLLKLIVPPRESAPLSGVCPLINSTCSNIAPVMLLTKMDRFIPPCPVIRLSHGRRLQSPSTEKREHEGRLPAFPEHQAQLSRRLHRSLGGVSEAV